MRYRALGCYVICTMFVICDMPHHLHATCTVPCHALHTVLSVLLESEYINVNFCLLWAFWLTTDYKAETLCEACGGTLLSVEKTFQFVVKRQLLGLVLFVSTVNSRDSAGYAPK